MSVLVALLITALSATTENGAAITRPVTYVLYAGDPQGHVGPELDRRTDGRFERPDTEIHCYASRAIVDNVESDLSPVSCF